MQARLWTAGLVALASLAFYANASAAKRAGEPAKDGGTLWTDPVDIASRNLYYGRGGEKDQPSSTAFQFVSEDMDGTNPKFNVLDSAGTKWKVKLGDETKPETVASRLVWAAGYFTDEDYFLPAITVEGLAGHIQRGHNLIGNGGALLNVRLKRGDTGAKKIGEWKWKGNPFVNTTEWNGLRVMMALINNWDLKDVNNAIYELNDKDAGVKRIVYGISDLGATFGAEHLDMGRKSDKGDYDTFAKTGFIDRINANTVDFKVPGAPSAIMMFNVPSYASRRAMMWIGKGIPREDARWLGTLLGKLSKQQISDAFRAGGYSYGEIENFAAIIEARIAALNQL